MKLEVRSGVVEAFDGLTLQRLDLSYALSLGLKGYSGSMAEVLLQDAMGGHRVVLMMILEKTIMILAPQSKVALQLSPRRSSQRGCACLGYWLLTPSTLRARVGVPLAVNVDLFLLVWDFDLDGFGLFTLYEDLFHLVENMRDIVSYGEFDQVQY